MAETEAAAEAAPPPEAPAALAEMTAERDALRTQCDSLASELREAKLREASLRKMIGLALAESIPSSTEVRSMSVEHAPIDA